MALGAVDPQGHPYRRMLANAWTWRCRGVELTLAFRATRHERFVSDGV
jgi:hypothetical protein